MTGRSRERQMMNKTASITTTIIVTSFLQFGNSAFARSIEPAKFLISSDKKDAKTKKTEPPEQEEKPLDFSDTGRPGQQTAGESRGGCVNSDSKLEAVVPVSHAGKTVSTHPSFWVYLPYNNKQVDRVEFILQNEAREDVWRSQFEANKNTGYKSFSLPKSAPPLQVGQWYRWYVKVYCRSNTASAQYVQSWVKRVPLTSKLYLELQEQCRLPHKILGNYGIWYDSVDRLIQEYQRQPTNIALEQDWQNLLQAKGVELQSLPNVGASYEAVK